MLTYLVAVFAGEELLVSGNGEAEWALDHILDRDCLHQTWKVSRFARLPAAVELSYLSSDKR